MARCSVETSERLAPEAAESLGGLFDAVTAVDGPPSIDADAWADLSARGRDGVVAFVARRSPLERPVGFAMLNRSSSIWILEYAVDPEARGPGDEVGEDLARAAVQHIAAAGGGPMQLWLNQPRPADERVAKAAGLVATRALYQFRRALPVGAGPKAGGGRQAVRTASITTRPFRPGEDEPAWLEVNNRAFSGHPEQGSWDLATVAGREAEPWFDPNGFLLHEIDGQLAGFCWTKVHDEEDPVQGEIYVIAVDPDFGARGLGRSLVLAGLDYLSGLGITVGMLYTDASNIGAVKLYVDLGFEVDHVNRAYTGDIEARSVASKP